MELTVKELCDRYGLSDRSTLYNVRLKGLKKLGYDATLQKQGNKAYADEKLIKLLDQLNKFMSENPGSPISSFVPTTEAQVTVHNTVDNTQRKTLLNPDKASFVETTQYAERYPLGHTAQLTTQSDTTQLIANLSQAIAEKMTPPNPLWYLAELERARASGWELTTSQIQALIGVKPSCKKGKKTFKRGSFVFVKVGKIGRETSWKVMKETDDGYKV